MSYTSLYRKFRPAEFEDVKGQEHIVTTLKNQIRTNRIGHAYLFCGTRGTGKTTVAKIFAKAVNCEHPDGESPCGECAMCRAIASGSSMNVVEIDAASNNGVDNVREIVNEVAYPPAEGKYRVYIIDEVHMLSIGAFNALLKTLEEPPSYVIFILATTEAHKIPITILSRCQRYDFKRIQLETIAGHMRQLIEKEGAQADERALRYIARCADGSMRDALSLLEQCMAFHFGEPLTYDMVLEVLGAVDARVFGRLFHAVHSADVAEAVRTLEEVLEQGRELTQFVSDFTWYLRNLLLLRISDQMEDVLDVSTENLAMMKQEAGETEEATLMRYIRVLSDLSNQLRSASQKRVLVEIAMIRLCRPQMQNDLLDLQERIRQIEHKLQQRPDPDPGAQQRKAADVPPAVQEKRPPVPEAIPEEVAQVVKNWERIVAQAPQPNGEFYRMAKLSLDGENRLLLVYNEEDSMRYQLVAEDIENGELDRLIEKQIGKKIKCSARLNAGGHSFEDVFPDLSDMVEMDIVEEE